MPHALNLTENKQNVQPVSFGVRFDGVRELVERNYARRRLERDRQFKYFGHSPQGDDRTLIDYINEMELRFNAYKLKPAWKEDWQANYVDQLTHDKTIAICARLAGMPYKSEYQPNTSSDVVALHRAALFEDINDYNEDALANREMDNFMRLLEAAIKGTIILFEDYGAWNVKATVISEYDPVTGEMKHKERIVLEGGLQSEIVPLEEFYPENIWEIRMEKQTACTWRQRMHIEDFKKKFRDWDNAEHVINKHALLSASTLSGEGSTDFKEQQLGYDSYVEILRDFDALENRYLICADGIPLTPIDTPMRWRPGRLPFASSGFEPISDKFFFWKSIVHRLENQQDGIDALFNAFYDKTMLAVLRPLIIGDMGEGEADDHYGPSSILRVRDASQVKEMQIMEPGSAALAAIARMQSTADQSAIDPVSAGSAGVGREKTATEVNQAALAARDIFSLFRRTMNWLEGQRGKLRAYNISIYYRRPKEILKVLGDDGKERWNMSFASFRIPNTNVLTPRGMEMGMRTIEIVPDRMSLESPEILRARNNLTRGSSEITQVTPKFFEDYDMNVKVIPVPAVAMTSELQRSMDRQFSALALGRPDLYHQDVIAKKLARAYNQSEEVVIQRSPVPSNQHSLLDRGKMEEKGEGLRSFQGGLQSLRALDNLIPVESAI